MVDSCTVDCKQWITDRIDGDPEDMKAFEQEHLAGFTNLTIHTVNDFMGLEEDLVNEFEASHTPPPIEQINNNDFEEDLDEDFGDFVQDLEVFEEPEESIDTPGDVDTDFGDFNDIDSTDF